MLKLTFIKPLTKPIASVVAFAQQTASATAGAASALWTFPSVLGSAILIAWAAEAAQFLVSQGLDNSLDLDRACRRLRASAVRRSIQFFVARSVDDSRSARPLLL